MEHKLIQGSTPWLPFARSRIKALRALGLPYASQKFTMPDGALCVVWIEPEQEYIRIDGGGGTLGMDSGVVDLISVNTLAVDTIPLYQPGILYETEAVTAYTVSYALKGNDNLRTNPSKDNNIQIAGKVHYATAFAGAVSVDRQEAESFRARRKPDPSDSTGTKTIANPDDDDALLLKKMVAVWCPASVFTGRCRLYVQALYGAFFSVNQTLSTIPDLVFGGNRTPYIKVPSYRPPSSTGQLLDPVPIWTSSGVYFDPLAGKHWLISAPAGDGKVYVYPLISSLTGESWRKFLRADSKTTLSSEAKEHLEAHILAYCLPDSANVQVIGTAFNKQDFGCGYGWHFNWAGDTADIVTHSVWDQGDGTHTGTTSTHYRLALSHATSEKITTFSASVSIVEGPLNWSTRRDIWGIVYPDYTSGVLYKLPESNTLVDNEYDAPFYVFYQRDVLRLCRMKLTSHAETTVASASPYASIGSLYSVGDQEGFSTSEFTSEYWDATISVGADTFGPCPNTYGVTETTYRIGDKATVGFGNGFSYGTLTWDPIVLSEGYPGGFNTDWSQVTIPYASYLSSDRAGSWTDFNDEYRLTSRGETIDSGLVAVIPFDDAEAICVRFGVTYEVITDKTGTHYTDKHTTSVSGGTWWGRGQYRSYDTDAHGIIVASRKDYTVDQAFYNLPPYAACTGAGYTSNVTTYEVPKDECWLFAGGNKNAANLGALPSISIFFVPGDYVLQYKRVTAGVNVTIPAIHTTGFGVEIGMPPGLSLVNGGHGPGPISLIGWT